MKRPDPRALLHDLVQACRLLEQFLAGKTLEDYKVDALTRSAVERQGEILGEVIAQLLQTSPTIAERITDARRIVAFRNRLIHGYATVSDEVVWGVMEVHVPVLQREAVALLAELNPEV